MNIASLVTHRALKVVVIGFCGVSGMVAMSVARAESPPLIAHWPLAGDLLDRSGQQRHLTGHGIEWSTDDDGRITAQFNGRDTWAELPDGIDLGDRPFSICTWIHTSSRLTDVLGDLVSQYDPQQRRGFHLSLMCAPGMTSSQSNFRNVHFGIDNGSDPPAWTDHGRMGEAVLIYSMAVHAGQLFVGTCVAGQQEAGRVFRYDGQSWTDCGAPDRCNAVNSMAEYQGHLYVGTGKYRLQGSSLAESDNPHLGGNVYRYDGDDHWQSCGNLPGVEAINGMVEFDGQLFATSMYQPAAFFRYAGESTWVPCETPQGKRTEALGVFNGYVYATGYDEGAVYRFDGQSWQSLGVLDDANQTYGFAVHQGKLFVSEWPNARVYRLDDATDDGLTWTLAGRLGDEKETMPLAVYNGKLYGGTLPSAEVYRYDGDTTWSKVARLDFTPDVRYRRVWSMAVYRGRLFAGTLPSGHVHSVEIGRNATYDQALPSGWHHLAAIREHSRLKLFVDGALVAESTVFAGPDFDLTNQQPFKVGWGSNDFLNGRISDLRVYAGALSAEEVQAMSRRP